VGLFGTVDFICY